MNVGIRRIILYIAGHSQHLQGVAIAFARAPTLPYGIVHGLKETLRAAEVDEQRLREDKHNGQDT